VIIPASQILLPSIRNSVSWLSAGTSQLSQQGISRRRLIFGLAIVGAAAGGAIWLTLTAHPYLQVMSIPKTPHATPTAPLGTTLMTYIGHSTKVTTIAWSPDNKKIASGSYDRTVQLWNASTQVLTFSPILAILMLSSG